MIWFAKMNFLEQYHIEGHTRDLSCNEKIISSKTYWGFVNITLVLDISHIFVLVSLFSLDNRYYHVRRSKGKLAFWKVGTDIASISANLIGRVLILYVETFKADIIVFIGEVIICLTSHWQIILCLTSHWQIILCLTSHWQISFSIRLSSFILAKYHSVGSM